MLTYNNGNNTIRKNVVKSNIDFPELYVVVRKFVDNEYAKTDSGTIYQTSKIIESVAELYNYKLNAKEHISWGSYVDTGTIELSNGLPLLWSTSSGTYGSHTMAVCGFQYYSKTTSWWTFSSTNYVLFYELRDGHSTQPRFFDMTGHYGFAAIINSN